MRNTLTLLSICLLFFTSCREDLELSVTDTTVPPPTITYGHIQLRGRVVDESGTPLQGAVINNFGEETSTDQNGFYSIPSVRRRPDGTATFYVTHEGYFTEYRQIIPSPPSIHKLDIILYDSSPDGTVNGFSGGTYESPEGPRLIVPAEAAISNGRPYTGEIRVKIAYADPTSYTDIEQSAANLPAWLDGERVELVTYGMAHVRIESTTGEEVTFSRDRPALLEMPLADEFARLIDTMSFWQLEELVWSLEGPAAIGNGMLSAAIFQSGNYNCDIPYPRATICGILTDDAGMPLQDQPFALVIDNGAFVFSTRTDERGQFCVRVARDQALRIRIPDPCNAEEILFEVAVGPFREGPTQIGEIIVESIPPRKPVNITDCADGGPVTQNEGLLWISGFGGGYPIRANDAGMAKLPLPDCGGSGTFEVQAVANDQRRTSPLVTVSADDLSSLDLEICSELESGESFLTNIVGAGAFPMDEVSYLLRQNQDGGFEHQLWGKSTFEGDTTEFFITLQDLTEGEYTVAPRVYRYEPGLRSSYLCDGCPSARVTILEVGPAQSYVKGAYSFLAVHRDLDTGDEIANPVVILGDFQINR